MKSLRQLLSSEMESLNSIWGVHEPSFSLHPPKLGSHVTLSLALHTLMILGRVLVPRSFHTFFFFFFAFVRVFPFVLNTLPLFWYSRWSFIYFLQSNSDITSPREASQSGSSFHLLQYFISLYILLSLFCHTYNLFFCLSPLLPTI